jgi:hypothetical protein
VEGIDLRHARGEPPIPGAVPRLREVKFVIEFLMAQKGQQQDAPTVGGPALGIGDIGRRISSVLVVVAGDRQRDLLEVSLVRRAVRRHADTHDEPGEAAATQNRDGQHR